MNYESARNSMANVNCYQTAGNRPSEQLVNSQYIQKILDENVGLIHAIIEKQQQNHEAEDLLKSLHKNLIYLATIADQTTSAGGPGGPGGAPGARADTRGDGGASAGASGVAAGQTPPQTQAQAPSGPMSLPPVQHSLYSGAPHITTESMEKKPQPPQSSGDDLYKECPSVKSSESIQSMNVDIDRDMDKCHAIRGSPNPQMAQMAQMPPALKNNVDIDKECAPAVSQSMADVSKDTVTGQSAANPEYGHKFEDTVGSSGAHMQHNPNIKPDMPPPSQPISIHQDKSGAMQTQQQAQQPQQQQPYPGNQRIMYPGVAPNYNQYNPHFEQNSKFYPPQNMYQQSPYNYQGMYGPYQPVAAPVTAPPSHYGQHMMGAPLYPQYPYYQPQAQTQQQQAQQAGMEHLPPPPPQGAQKEAAMSPQMSPQMQHHAAPAMPQPMYPAPSSAPGPPQSLYGGQQGALPPQQMPHSIKSPATSESLAPVAPPQSQSQSNQSISE